MASLVGLTLLLGLGSQYVDINLLYLTFYLYHNIVLEEDVDLTLDCHLGHKREAYF
jgi:hypothetical protein